VTIGAQSASSAVTLQVRATGSGSLSGYQCNISATPTNTLAVYRFTAGSFVQLGSTVTGLTISSGDVFSLTAAGPSLIVYQNYKLIFFWVDTTFTSGSPGFGQTPFTNVANSKIFSWRGYNCVQQDGIWQKLGTPAGFYPISTDINTGVSFVNSGVDSASIVLHEGNAQILSGTVYKMWFGTASGIQYSESSDGLSWTRYGSTVIAGFSFPQVIKVAGTYYLYAQSNTVAAGQGAITAFTSTDGINWTNHGSTGITVGTAGQWDVNAVYLFSPVYVDGGGTWWALYSGVGNSNTTFAMGIANSTDGLTWTKRGGNPVVNSVWASVPYLINGSWYLWSDGVPPGIASGLNPTQGLRSKSADLITWTNQVVSIKNTQLAEGVNSTTSFAYPNSLVEINGKTYMYYEGGPSNTASNTGTSWNMYVAVVNATMAQIVTRNEDALQQTATDDFGTPGALAAPWVTATGFTALQVIAGGKVEPTATATNCAAVYAGTFSNDQYSSAKLLAAVGNSDFSLWLRANSVVNTKYQLNVAGPAGTLANHCQIFSIVNGTATAIGPVVPITPQVNDIWTFSVIGNVLSAFQNGWLILQVEDVNNSITSGNPGILLLSPVAVTDSQIGQFRAGNANVYTLSSSMPTTITITMRDGTTVVVTIPNGYTASQYIQSLRLSGGVFSQTAVDPGTGAQWWPYRAWQKAVAS
jgi:hypothetical protein